MIRGYASSPLRQTLAFARRPYAFMEAGQKRFGEPFSARFIGDKRGVFFSHPDALKDIFNQPKQLLSGLANHQLVAAFLGEQSLLVLDGDAHLRQRRMLLPAFRAERMRVYGDLMARLTEQRVSAWAQATTLPLQRELLDLTRDVILYAVLGLTNEREVAVCRSAMDAVLSSITPALVYLPFWRRDYGRYSPGGRYLRSAARFDALLADIVARRRSVLGGSDVLSALLAARDEAGDALTEAELRDVLVTLIFAGHETTSAALAWAVHWLARTQDAQMRLRDEAAAAADTDTNDYLDAVCKETLRLCPVIPVVVRQAIAPVTVAGNHFPAGTRVNAAIYLTHRRDNLYPEPQHFRPERFLERRFSIYEYLPFGGGTRRCLGAAFATYQMRVVLGTLSRRLRLHAETSAPPQARRLNLTLSPSGGARVRVSSW